MSSFLCRTEGAVTLTAELVLDSLVNEDPNKVTTLK